MCCPSVCMPCMKHLPLHELDRMKESCQNHVGTNSLAAGVSLQGSNNMPVGLNRAEVQGQELDFPSGKPDFV